MSKRGYRRWVFTVHSDAALWSDEALRDPDAVRFFVYQRELAPTTGQLHVQGYVEFNKQTTMSRCKAFLGRPDAHLERANGSSDDNIAYCTKEDSRAPGAAPCQWGTPATVSQGHRSDLDEVKEHLDNGGTIATCFDNYFATTVRYHRGLQLYLMTRPRAPMRPTLSVYFVTGPTSIGKTHWAWTTFPDLYCLDLCQPIWFDRYAGQTTLLLDDLSPQTIQFPYLLRLLDNKPMILPVKGGSVEALWLNVIITSNLSFEELFPLNSLTLEQRNAMLMRISFMCSKTTLKSDMEVIQNRPSRMFPADEDLSD